MQAFMGAMFKRIISVSSGLILIQISRGSFLCFRMHGCVSLIKVWLYLLYNT